MSHIDDVAAVRPFNRFYTSRLGMVRNGRHRTGHPPAEGRVLYEHGQADALDVTELKTRLRIDGGRLSRRGS